MNTQMHLMRRLVVPVCAAVVIAVAPTVIAAQSVGGKAYGVYVNTPVAWQSQSPVAVLPAVSGTDGNMATAEAAAFAVPSAVSSEFLNSTTTGAMGTAGSSAQSTASLAQVSILDGLITADEVIANATSYRSASGTTSNGNGSSFENLQVAGVPVTSGDATVAPNTRMDLPNVGYVVLNEMIPTGDGMTSSGVTVNMVHVVLQQPILGLLGQVVGYQKVGEIIVGSAQSRVGS